MYSAPAHLLIWRLQDVLILHQHPTLFYPPISSIHNIYRAWFPPPYIELVFFPTALHTGVFFKTLNDTWVPSTNISSRPLNKLPWLERVLNWMQSEINRTLFSAVLCFCTISPTMRSANCGQNMAFDSHVVYAVFSLDFSCVYLLYCPAGSK